MLAAQPAGEGGFTAAAMLLLFAYAGFENTAAAAGEFRNPRRDIPFALMMQVALVTVIYVGVQAVALATLPDRDAKVLKLYFGLDGGREHTLEEIGQMLGVTRERVRQLRDRALKRLGAGAVGRALRSFAA